MGFFGKLFGGERGGAAENKPAPAPAATAGSKKLCAGCQRALLPGTPCPFCNPQQFGEDLPEGTISRSYERQAGVTGGMGGVMVATHLAQQHGAKGFLHIYQGTNKGLSILLASKAVSLGRTPENVVALNDGGVSSKHCEVRPTQGGYEVVDLGSKNGTFVNDARVKEKALANGDLIAFGNTRIYVGLL